MIKPQQCETCKAFFDPACIKEHYTQHNGVIESCLSKSGLVKAGFRLQSIVGQPQGYWSLDK